MPRESADGHVDAHQATEVAAHDLGDVVLRHGSLTNLDEKAVYALARESARSMGERSGVKPHSPWPSVA